MTARSSACAWPASSATLSISATALAGSRSTSSAAARAFARTLNSFCDDRVVQVPGEPGAFLQHRQLTAALVQPGVRQGDRGVRGEQAEHALVPLGEAAGGAFARGEDEAEDAAATLTVL